MKIYEERTETRIIEYEGDAPAKPKYHVGQYAQVYCGYMEGHQFAIYSVRWNVNRECFQYLYKWTDGGCWYGENEITLVRVRASRSI